MRGSAVGRGRGEHGSLAWRLGSLQLARVLMAALAAAAAWWLPGHVAAPAAVSWSAAAYAVGTGLVELARRRWRVRSALLVSASLLADGVWVALVVYGSSSLFGPLRVLVLLHVMAVTLLLSWRTGLKVAVWHLLLLLLAASGALPGLDAGTDERAVAFGGLTVVLMAGAAAWFSGVNEHALRRGKAELTALVALTESLERADTGAEIRAALLDHVVRRLGFRRAALVDHDADGVSGAVADGRSLVLFESSAPAPAPSLRHPSEAGVLTGTRALRMVHELDPEADALADRLLPAATNVVVVPISVDGQAVTTLYAEWAGLRRRVSTQTVAVLVQSCHHVAQALRSERLRSEVEWLATRDPLTGVFNRAVFDERLTQSVAWAQRHGEPLSLIVLDVDRFKDVNDGFGHQAGDEVLRVLGSTLLANSRVEDIAARFGGDEFAVLLPGCEGPQALSIAERLRQSIATGLPLTGITISAGVASLPRSGGTPQQLMAAADVALYQSKRDGRNRTSRFEEPTVTLSLPAPDPGVSISLRRT